MRIRPYIEHTDYTYLEKWIDTEEIHALWCANHIPYPVTRKNLHALLEKNTIAFMDSAYVATEDDGTAVGFFCYSLHIESNEGFLKFIIVDNEKRGKGYGFQMLQLLLQYAFTITKAASVQLNVFPRNTAAMHCYKKAGFIERATEENAFSYKNELWSRCNMAASKESLRFDN